MKKSYNCAFFSHKREFYARGFRIMKITALLLLVGISIVFAGSSYSQNAQLSLRIENGTLTQLAAFSIKSQKNRVKMNFFRDKSGNIFRSHNVSS